MTYEELRDKINEAPEWLLRDEVIVNDFYRVEELHVSALYSSSLEANIGYCSICKDYEDGYNEALKNKP